MKKGGIGSASILMVFAVLCLTVFAVLSLTSARFEKTMTGNQKNEIDAYYKADLLAEQILAGILDSDIVPDTLHGVEITTETDLLSGTDIASYSCPISGQRELYVRAEIKNGFCNVLEWRMRNTGEWEPDDDLPILFGG